MKAKAWYIVFINSLVGCCIAATFPQFSITVANLSIKSGIPESILLTSDTVKSCGIVAAMLVSGFLYKRFGARAIFIYSSFAIIIPQLLFIHIHEVWLLMIFKFIQGTASVIFPVFMVLIMEVTNEKNLGLATAVFNGIFYSGGGIGGTLAGFVIARSSWEMSYYVMAIIQIVLCIIWFFTVKPRPPEGVAEEETSLSKEKTERNLLLTGKIWLLAVSFLATTWAVQAITVDMPLFSGAKGFSELETGKILTAVTIGMIISCLVSGKISDFFAARSRRKDLTRIIVLIFGYIIVILSVLFMIFADMSSFMVLYIAALMFTFGASWGLGAFYCILPEIYDEKTVPIVTGITGGIGDVGMPLAPLIVGVAFGIRGMWGIGWGSCMIMALISILAAAALMIILKKRD